MNILYISLNKMNRSNTSPHYIYIIQNVSKITNECVIFLIIINNNLFINEINNFIYLNIELEKKEKVEELEG